MHTADNAIPSSFLPQLRLWHVGVFSLVFLMLVAAMPAPSMSYGHCGGTVTALEGPLLPTAA